jgi:hypothetical protein
MNFEIQNQALLLKQLHKFYCQADTPWVKLVWSLYSPDVPPHAQTRRGSFWWCDVFSLVNTYRSITSSQISDGRSTLFWKDFWQSDELLCDRFPHLFSYAMNEDISVGKFSSSDNTLQLFALPLSVQAFDELSALQTLTNNLVIVPDSVDTRLFSWGTAQYTSARFYKFIFGAYPEDKTLKSIWKSKCLPKLRVFAWLLMMDRLNTKDLMMRKNWQVDGGTGCVLCNTLELETRDHLFFGCPYAAACWARLHIQWDCSLPISSRFLRARNLFKGPCFMEVFVCAAWNIWKDRNDLIFKAIDSSLARWCVRFKNDLHLHTFRVKPSLVQPLSDFVLTCFD